MKWDKRYLDLCDLVASWSKDPSSQFGAVIVDSNNQVVSLGFNGFARGFEDTTERWCDRQFKYRHVIHAEENALLTANRNLSDCKIYVQMCPCSSCMSKIAQSGIKQVICRSPSEDYLSRWSVEEPLQVAKECGIVVKQYNNSSSLGNITKELEALKLAVRKYKDRGTTGAKFEMFEVLDSLNY